MQSIRSDLNELAQQEDALIFDNCFEIQNSGKSSWIDATRSELINTFEYLQEAKRHISRLRSEIIQDKYARDKSFDSQQYPTSNAKSIIKTAS